MAEQQEGQVGAGSGNSRPTQEESVTSMKASTSFRQAESPQPKPSSSSSACAAIPFPSSHSHPNSPPMSFPSLEPTSGRRRDAALSYNPAMERTRSRRISMPANLIQTRHNSMVFASGTSTLRVKEKAEHRMSVASFSSIESVAEEVVENGEVVRSSSSAARRPRAVSRRSASPAGSRPSSMARPPNPSRHSLPANPYHGGYQSFSMSTISGESSGSKQASGNFPATDGDEKREMTPEAREKREERRWRIAEELKGTEKAYVQVLEEIDARYYQPLIAALPADNASRGTSTRSSTMGPPSDSASPTTSPRASIYSPVSLLTSPRSRTSTRESGDSTYSSPSTAPSTPPTPLASTPSGPILNRREINEVFSNFTDVLNLSHVMFLAVEEAVPERPSQPLPVVLSQRKSAVALTESPADLDLVASAPVHSGLVGSSSLESQAGGLSTSLETTASSAGPATPEQDGSPVPGVQGRARTTSTRSFKRNRNPALPIRLGKALLPILPFLKQYSLFVANFSGSLARLSSLEAAPSAPVAAAVNGSPGSTSEDRVRWQAFAEEVQKLRIDEKGRGSGKIGLGGLLLNIVQRVPRYRLLLLDLIRCTEEDHPDLRDLRTAFALVDGVASHLESQIQSHTNDLQILDLQRAFTNLEAPILAPGRRLLKTGILRKLNRSGKEQVRTFYLFNDILLHASGGEGSGWGAMGLGIANVVFGGEEGAMPSSGGQYFLHRRFELEDVTVIGSDEITETGLRYGFEILSTEKSFAVYADSLETKMAWLDAIRDAKAALMSDRRTLQRVAYVERVSPASTVPSSPATPRNAKRISLPAGPPSSPLTSRPTSYASHLAVPPAVHRQVSLPPSLASVPPTPAVELDEASLVFPVPDETPPRLVDSPAMLPSRSNDSLSIRSMDLGGALPSTSSTSSTMTVRPPVRPTTLSRSRRWSEMHPTAAVQALASALSLSSSRPTIPSAEDVANPNVEYRVIGEEYHAPVWYPDSKAIKCKCCRALFGIIRRKHHCRLCGGVICWSCSTKYFIIPGSLLKKSSSDTSSFSSSEQQQQQPDRLARACDPCWSSVFDAPPPASRFLSSHPTDDSDILRHPSASFSRTHPSSSLASASTLTAGGGPPERRQSRILAPQTPNSPLFDFEISSPPFEPFEKPPPSGLAREIVVGEGEGVVVGAHATKVKRGRRVSAVGELRRVLER